ncbi:Na+/H+ antiporter NhaA [Oceanithermus sp.]
MAGEAKGGVLLFAAALLAFAVSNSPWAQAYFDLQGVYLKLQVGDWVLKKSLLHFVNDFLMAFFFLLVGLELKREILTGELRGPLRAGLAVAAALGGMVTPALIYTAFNYGGEGAAGWGVPMATDIAFALGVVALIPRVPLSLKVFLTALAIVDDLGAVLVIAVFYSGSLNLHALALAAGVLALALLAGRLRLRSLAVYGALGLFLWYYVMLSGVHATVAGVLLALAVPMESDVKTSPLHRLEHLLHPYVAYLIMPLFAFFNAGVALSGTGFGAVSLGVFLGLLLGKPAGILLFSFLAVALGLAELPRGASWGGILAVGLVAGIGFTMALFIAGLAFPPQLLDEAKIGVLSASLTAAVIGGALLWRSGSISSV